MNIRLITGTITAACFAIFAYSSSAQMDQLFVADDGVNTGGVGEYNATIASGSASGSAVNAALITTPPAGASAQVRMSLASNGQDLFVGEWVQGKTTATIGEYTMAGTAIDSFSISDSAGAPALAVDGQGDLFVGVDATLSEYSASGTLEKSIVTGVTLPGGAKGQFTSLSLDGSGNLFAAFSGGDPLLGRPYGGRISEYTTGGSVVNLNVVTAQNYINSIAAGAGDLFVSYQDGPPSIVNKISQYTTGGSVVNGSFIQGLSGGLALDGQGNLFLDSYGDGTVSAYTTGGTLLTSDFLTGVTEPEAMAVFPTPEPSVTALSIVGAAVIVSRKGAKALIKKIFFKKWLYIP
jgi:hypothetical protein